MMNTDTTRDNLESDKSPHLHYKIETYADHQRRDHTNIKVLQLDNVYNRLSFTYNPAIVPLTENSIIALLYRTGELVQTLDDNLSAPFRKSNLVRLQYNAKQYDQNDFTLEEVYFFNALNRHHIRRELRTIIHAYIDPILTLKPHPIYVAPNDEIVMRTPTTDSMNPQFFAYYSAKKEKK